MMGRWVLSGAFLMMCLVSPGSPEQEHIPISSEQIYGQSSLLASQIPNVFKYYHRNQFLNASRACKELIFINVSESPSDPKKSNAIKSPRIPWAIKKIKCPNATRSCNEPRFTNTEKTVRLSKSSDTFKTLSEFWFPCFHRTRALSDKYSEKQAGPVAKMKPRKERTVYSKEQTRLLQEHFHQCQSPDKKKREELAALVGVTECEIKIWFKNNRAKCKKMNLQNIPKALPETNGSPKSVFESTHVPGSTPLVAAENGESMYSGTFGVDSIPKLHRSQKSSLPQYQACDGARCSQQEALLDGHAPVTAGDSGQSAAVEVQTDLAVTETPVGLAAAAQRPEDAQGSGPSAEELWQGILEDFDISEDWLTLRYITTPSTTSQPLEQFRPLQP